LLSGLGSPTTGTAGSLKAMCCSRVN
jgi:hypothetical protein